MGASDKPQGRQGRSASRIRLPIAVVWRSAALLFSHGYTAPRVLGSLAERISPFSKLFTDTDVKIFIKIQYKVGNLSEGGSEEKMA